MISKILDSRAVRALPDVHLGPVFVVRAGWNFRPDWDRSLAQPWRGRWWLWLGPYILGIGSGPFG